MQDLFVVHSSSLPPTARVMGFRGTEGISRCYELDVFVYFGEGEGSLLDLGDAVSGRIAVEVVGTLGEPPWVFSGVISEIEMVNEIGPRSVFRVRFVPQLWWLGLSLHSRIFTKKSIPEIISAVLDENGLGGEYELRLKSAYPIEEHVTQYRENDLAFLSRWMEHEGIYYYFEHGLAGEKLILVDDKSSHQALDARPARYYPSPNDWSAGEQIHFATLQRSAMPARVLVSDYDYLKPGLGISGTGDVSHNGLGDVAVYGDRVFTAGDAQRVASVRAESLRANGVALTARGTKRRLRSGYTFELEEHPRRELDQAWLVTSMEHIGRQVLGAPELDDIIGHDDKPDVYQMSLRAIPASLQYRDVRRTPWPRVFSFENGTVDGPATSTYAQIDDHGRYAVKMHFDEGPLKGGEASTWVRMAQPHAGGLEGFHFPLRKGTEVLVEFLDGDPDRPVIAAVLPNAATPSPVTSGNNTKNVLQTGGSTRQEIEDADGGQYSHTTTPPQNTSLWMGTDATSKGGHNVEHSTDGSGGKSFGSYFDWFVGGTKAEQVVGDVTRNYDAHYNTNVLSNVQQLFDSNQSTTVLSSKTRLIVGTLTETVTKKVTESFQSTWNLFVSADLDQTFQANQGMKIGGTQEVTVTAKAQMTDNAGLAVTVNGALSKHVATSGYALEAVPSANVHVQTDVKIRGDANALLSAPATTVDGDGSVDVLAGADIGMKTQAVAVTGSALINLNGPVINIMGGEITIKGGNITAKASGKMTVAADGQAVAAAAGAMTIHGGPSVDVKGGVIQLNLGGASPSGLGPLVDALIALDPTLANKLAELQKAGWTIKYGNPGDPSYFDKAKKIIVLDGNLKTDPQAAFSKLSELQDGITNPKTPLLPQEKPMSCVVAASRMIIDTQTGQNLPEGPLRTESSGMPNGYNPANGTYYNTADDLMRNHGVSGASEYRPLTVDDLQQQTANGDPALVSISHHDAAGNRTGGHAVVVDSVTNNPDGTRTINIRDPDGNNRALPENQFNNDYYGNGSGTTYDGMGITTNGSH